MRPHLLLSLTLAAAMVTPVSAGEGQLTPSDASLVSALSVVAAPFSLASVAGEVLSQKASADKLERNKQWRVAALRPQGDKTAIELRSDDNTLKLDTLVATTTARAQKLQVSDEIGLETIGKSGYALKKAGATIGVLVRPDSGLVHSKART